MSLSIGQSTSVDIRIQRNDKNVYSVLVSCQNIVFLDVRIITNPIRLRDAIHDAVNDALDRLVIFP